MHWNVEQILWAFLLAAHLVLLIVLLGRDRASRFPWFTAVTALAAVSLLANHLLFGKLTTVAFYWQSYTALAVSSVLGIFVLIELARRVFSSGKAGLLLKPRGWIGWTLVTIAITTAAVWAWGPWPTWQALKAEPAQLPLLIVVLAAMKGQLFVSLLTVQVALLLRFFGRRFGYGWRSHAQQIALGLSTNALGFLVVQGISDSIKRTVHLTSRQEYDRVVHLFANMENARNALWLLVLIWWIIWLWRDEPGSTTAILVAADAPALTGPSTLQAEILESNSKDAPESDPELRD
jgi:hypothetical protein